MFGLCRVSKPVSSVFQRMYHKKYDSKEIQAMMQRIPGWEKVCVICVLDDSTTFWLQSEPWRSSDLFYLIVFCFLCRKTKVAIPYSAHFNSKILRTHSRLWRMLRLHLNRYVVAYSNRTDLVLHKAIPPHFLHLHTSDHLFCTSIRCFLVSFRIDEPPSWMV